MNEQPGTPAPHALSQNQLYHEVSELTVHHHVCLLYKTQEEQFAATIPFICLGLERREKCLYIVDENTAATVLQKLQAHGRNIDAALRSGQLEILTKKESYLKEGFFDPDQWMLTLKNANDAAQTSGYTALRTTSEMTWALGKEIGVERLAEYEAKLNLFLPDHNTLALGQYNLERFPVTVIKHIIQTHPLIIFRGVISKNYYYVPPEEFLALKPEQNEVRRLLDNIADRHRVDTALLESESRLNEAQRLAQIGSWDWNIATDTIKWSAEYYRIFSFDPKVPSPNYQDHLKIYTPESAELLDGAVQKAMQSGEPYELDLEIANPIGLTRWITTRGEAKRDADGKIIGLRGTAQNITDRKRTEEVLQKSETRFRQTLDGMLEGCIILGFDWTYLYLNATAEQHGQNKRENLMGRTILEMYPGIEKSGVFNHYRRCMEERIPQRFEDSYTFADGVTKWYTLSAEPIPEGIFVLSIDVTEQKRAEAALKKSQRLFAETEKVGKVGGWEINIDTKKTTWTEEVYNIYEVDSSTDTTVIQGISAYTPASRPIIERAVREAVEDGKSFDLELEIITGKGNLRNVHSIGKADLEHRRVYGFFQDITNRKRLENELLAAKTAAVDAAKSKAKFLDIAAHELKTPVTAFCMMLELANKRLKKGQPFEAATLERLLGQANGLSRLVVDLLDVSRLERGILTLRRVSTDMVSLISNCLEEFGIQAPQRHYVFTKPEQSVEIDVDPVRIKQVIINFLDNAIKYTPEDSPIEVSIELPPGLIRISVTDHGAGIPKEQLIELFKPFSRGSTDRVERAGGLGLGLFISHGIVELHGGTLGVVSEIGIGSTFYFELPRKET